MQEPTSLPLLQQDALVICNACKRVIMADAFESHRVRPRQIPPHRDRAAPTMRARVRQAVCQKLPLKDLIAEEEAASGNPNARPRSRSPHKEKEPTPKGKGPPTETAEVCQQWEGNTADQVCGVRRTGSSKPCMRPLNCKYHTAQQKRGVLGRSLPFDQLYAAFQKQQVLQRQQNLPLAQPKTAAHYAMGARSGAERLPAHGGYGAGAGAPGASGYGHTPMAPPVVVDPDPLWQAEWARLLHQMPTMQVPFAPAAVYTLCTPQLSPAPLHAAEMPMTATRVCPQDAWAASALCDESLWPSSLSEQAKSYIARTNPIVILSTRLAPRVRRTQRRRGTRARDYGACPSPTSRRIESHVAAHSSSSSRALRKAREGRRRGARRRCNRRKSRARRRARRRCER